jgi:hypothetical protein
MVVGPILDAMAARRTGSSAVAVVSKNHRLLVAGLSLSERVAFWSTNMPYWALAAYLADEGLVLHAVSAGIVAAASTAFHGVVMFGAGSPWYDRATQRLIVLDILAANAYGGVLATGAGLAASLRVFGPAVLLLTLSAVLKRRGSPRGYIWLHGTWHVLSAYGMWRVLMQPPTSGYAAIPA